MKKLDKYLNEKSKLEFEVKGKTYIANVNALTLLSIVDLGEKATAKEVTQATFEAAFGKDQATALFENLNLEGINVIAEDIQEALGLSVDSTNTPR